MATASGSSPLTRGKQALGGVQDAQGGLIPAHAGKTGSRPHRPARSTAHPRSRGENSMAALIASSLAGSSPLTRGKRPSHLPGARACGLIPAHAGKTASCTAHCRTCKAHPRSRGENEYLKRGSFISPGSSPLTRGKLNLETAAEETAGLIPAHAGKTRLCIVIRSAASAHPRSRGENP